MLGSAEESKDITQPSQSLTTADDMANFPSRLPSSRSSIKDTPNDGTSTPNTSAPALSKTRRIVIAGLMIMPYYLTSSNSAIAFLLVPSIERDLDESQLAVQWVASAYSLANGGLLVSGRLADMFGRKYLFLLGLITSGVFGLASGFVKVLIPLCILRALTGLGLAVAMPAAFGIVGSTFTTEPGRTIAFSAMGTGYPIGSGSSGVLGGLIATSAPDAWPYAFVMLAGMAFVAAAIGVVVLPPETKTPHGLDRRIDWLGAVMVTTSIALLSFAITQGGLVSKGWREPYIPVVFCISILLLVAFGIWQHYLKNRTSFPPLVDLATFTRYEGKITALLATSFSAYCAINGWLYVTAQWFQVLRGDTPLEYSLHVLTAPIMGVVACLVTPIIAIRVRAPVVLVFGAFSTAAACWLFAVQPDGATYWSFEFIANIVNPWGADLTVGIGSVLMSNFAVADEHSLLGALFQTVIAFSGTIGTCLAALLQSKVYESTGDVRKSLDASWWLLAGFAWLACLIVIAFLRDIRLAKDVRRDLAHLEPLATPPAAPTSSDPGPSEAASKC